MRNSFAVSRSRTRNPTISFSVSSLGTAISWIQVSPRATLRTQSTSAALVTLRYTTPCAPAPIYFCALSPVSASNTTRVRTLFAACSTALNSPWKPPATISTAARNLSSAMNICSEVCACATIRISSSTASTLAIPARKIAWLSANISLSIAFAPQSRVANELVRVDDAGYAARLRRTARGWFIGTHYASATLDHYVFFSAGDIRRQRNFKLHRRSHVQVGIGADVYAGGAKVPSHSAGLSPSILLMNLYGQFQRKSFSGTCFGHGT